MRLEKKIKSRAIRRLAREESGMTMGLTVIMVVVIGVMGAGLLTFVQRDLNAVVEVNQGQRALEISDAGVQTAKRQLLSDSTTTKYDGGTDDVQWSSSISNSSCSSLGTTGMCLNNLDGEASTSDSVNVTIQSLSTPANSFRVISTGGYGNAKRKIEAVVRSSKAGGVTYPRTYLTRTNLCLSGSINPSGISMFALGNATIGNNVDLGTLDDRYYGRWAEASGAGSYPNAFNATARSTSLSAVAARGTVSSGSHSTQTRSARVLSGAGSSTTGTPVCPSTAGSLTSPQVVSDYYTSTLSTSQKIAFPFQVPTESEDRAELEVLRQRALSQETSSNPLYIDSSPGNKVDDTGLTSCAAGTTACQTITTWPSNSNYDTVRFYKFRTYSSGNVVKYNPSTGAECSSTTPPKGVIAVENGDFVYDGNKAFNGGIIVRAYNASGNSVEGQGKFTASGSPCLKGYANSGGTMAIAGNLSLGDVPELGTLEAFKGGTEQISWRELFE